MATSRLASVQSVTTQGLWHGLGYALLIMGLLICSTFWLLPLGLPLALLGVAFIASNAGATKSHRSYHAPENRSASADAFRRVLNYAERFRARTGTSLNPEREIRNSVVSGLAKNLVRSGKLLCPCVHDPNQDLGPDDGQRRLCPCNEMRTYKCCVGQLFVSPSGLPITEHLPEDHAIRQKYGLVCDPSPNLNHYS